jgi:hypothetical protein
LLYNTQFTVKRIDVVAKKMIKEVTQWVRYHSKLNFFILDCRPFYTGVPGVELQCLLNFSL